MEKAVPSPEDLVASTTKLYSPPDIYFRVQAIVDDPGSSMTELAQVISADPGITARLLRLANSAYFGMAMRVDTVHKAINLLGMLQVHDLVLATSVVQTFSGIPGSVMNMERFWHRSVHCGVLARLLATACNVIDNERMFVTGLLHDIGHLLMYQGIPEQARAALLQAEREEMPLFRVERALIGFDYAQAGAALMRSWNLPTGLQEAIEFHPEPSRAESFPRETSLVHIAAQLAAHAEVGDPQALETGIDPVVWAVTGLDPAALGPLRQEASQQLDLVTGLIMP